MSSRILPTAAFVFICAAVLARESAGPAPGVPPAEAMAAKAATTPAAKLLRVTPILAVDSIEPVLPFWEALGFTPINPTRENGRLIFIGFAKDTLEIHYRTRANVRATIPAAAGALANATALIYLTVDNLDSMMAALTKSQVLIPRRRTQWGSDEIYVREPGGNILAFAAFGR